MTAMKDSPERADMAARSPAERVKFLAETWEFLRTIEWRAWAVDDIFADLRRAQDVEIGKRDSDTALSSQVAAISQLLEELAHDIDRRELLLSPAILPKIERLLMARGAQRTLEDLTELASLDWGAAAEMVNEFKARLQAARAAAVQP